MKKILQLCLFALTILSASATNNSTNFIFTDDGELRGRVTDKEFGTGIPSANVVIMHHNQIVYTATTNENGDFEIKPLRPGNYDVKASYVSYNALTIQNVVVNANKFTEVNFALSSNTSLPPAIVIWEEPMIQKDNVITCKIIKAEEIKTMPFNRIQDMAATTAGVYQKEEGGDLNVRGSRTDASQYYVDGVKVIGGLSLPKNAISQMQVITGGIPAMFGDATGGIIVITTKSYLSGW